MTRIRLPDRRFSVTAKVTYPMENGKEVKLLVTIGYHPDTKKALEVFCADFKAGTSLHALVMDASIVLSRCLQHGDDPAEIGKSLTPGSLLGVLVQAIIDNAPDK